MNSGITKILLPITVGEGGINASKFAFNLARDTGAEVVALLVDDDSPWYETTLLPFHTKTLNQAARNSEQSEIPANNSQIERLLSLSKEMNMGFRQMIVAGHTATQILLVSRYHDIIVLPEDPQFAHIHGVGPRRVNPLLEIMDQTIVPILLSGKNAPPELGSAAIYFDGSPYATIALHQLAHLYQKYSRYEITIRVSTFEPSTAKQLAKDAANFLTSKGLNNIKIEYSTQTPTDFAQSHSDDSASLAILGIRSRQAFHDFRIGTLAHHFLENEPTKNKLFC